MVPPLGSLILETLCRVISRRWLRDNKKAWHIYINMPGFDLYGSPERARTSDLVINSHFNANNNNPSQQIIINISIAYSISLVAVFC